MADETERREKTLSERSQANLSRARKLAGQHFERDDEQSRFFLEYAEVQALLAVAEALRENPLPGR